MSYISNTVHFTKRKYDKKFEVIAQAEIAGALRWVTLDVIQNHKDAVEAVRTYRSAK